MQRRVNVVCTSVGSICRNGIWLTLMEKASSPLTLSWLMESIRSPKPKTTATAGNSQVAAVHGRMPAGDAVSRATSGGRLCLVLK